MSSSNSGPKPPAAASAAAAAMERHQSIDAQLRLLAPGKVSEDDKLVEYDALLVDRFLDILQDLHGPLLREFVQDCYELAAEYGGGRDAARLGELGGRLTGLAPADAIVVASSFSHMLNLANLAEEVQIAHRRRNKLKRGDFADEASATTESDIEETLKRLVSDLGKSREEVFDALKSQTVDLVFTAHPTQSIRRSLLQKHARIRNCLRQLYAKDITADDKQELDEALQREGHRHTDLMAVRVRWSESPTLMASMNSRQWAPMASVRVPCEFPSSSSTAPASSTTRTTRCTSARRQTSRRVKIQGPNQTGQV